MLISCLCVRALFTKLYEVTKLLSLTGFALRSYYEVIYEVIKIEGLGLTSVKIFSSGRFFITPYF